MSSIKLTADSGGGTFEIKAPSSSGNTRVLTLPDTGNLTLHGGRILQVASTTRTDIFSEDLTVGTFSADALTVSITPSDASNKILILVNLTMGCEASQETKFQIFKAGVIINGATGDAAGNRTRITSAGSLGGTGELQSVSGQFLDTAGGTSAITYSVRLGTGSSATRFIYLNQSHTNANNNYESRATSTMTVMEVAA